MCYGLAVEVPAPGRPQIGPRSTPDRPLQEFPGCPIINPVQAPIPLLTRPIELGAGSRRGRNHRLGCLPPAGRQGSPPGADIDSWPGGTGPRIPAPPLPE